ncbi:hypothetical protein [Mucilaginibacter paludis]|uniref:Uncharacterized protein n=1 Tax=Mucilaginibacter paludis DSM 18603 TaxID=714943 RepID=H1XZ80_9SPHI|nr:hypothetical protein [Mucilaginibacter paludis]EHQ24665.1 hypothetical protein Mucpa_0471 [Mucilaginibacter paludis DSM 18603]
MRLFTKRKTGSNIANHPSLKVGLLIAEKQRKAADYLSRKTQYWNRNSKIVALVIFCLLFGGACLLLLIKAIIHF